MQDIFFLGLEIGWDSRSYIWEFLEFGNWFNYYSTLFLRQLNEAYACTHLGVNRELIQMIYSSNAHQYLNNVK